MKYLRSQWSLWTIVTALATAVLLSAFAEAADRKPQNPRTAIIEIPDDPEPSKTPQQKVPPTPTPGSGTATPGASASQAQAETQESLLKKHLHRTSFDRAATANEELARWKIELACKNPSSNTCKEAKQIFADQNHIAGKASEIAKEQNIMADISRASDVAGVAAVGAAAGSEMMKKPSQTDSLESVAKIQKVGGIAGITAGVTDIALASKAYFDQTKKLEMLREDMRKGKTVNQQLVRDLEEAIKKTKEAAFAHATVGAAKVGAGALSLKMAKDNLKAKSTLESAPKPPTYYTVPLVYGTPPVGGSTVSFSPTGGTSTGGTTGGTGGTTSGTTGGSATGASSAPAGYKFPYKADSAAKAAAPSSAAPSAGLSMIAKSKEEKDAKAEGDKDEKEKEVLASFSHYGSGSGFSVSRGPASEGPGLDGLFNQMLNPGNGTATGINPNALMAEAQASEEAYAEDSGISDSEKSLFDVTKAKYAQMMAQGRLVGAKGIK